MYLFPLYKYFPNGIMLLYLEKQDFFKKSYF